MKSSIKKLIQTYRKVKSIRKTAELTGYSKSGVEYLLKQNNIQLFPRNRKGSENSQRKAINELDDQNPRKLIRNTEYMFELYIQKKMSIPEIGKLLNLCRTTILTGLKQCGIKRRTKSESLKGKPHLNAQGSKHRDWKGGISGWRKLARGRLNESFVYPIMKRDNFTCQWCTSKKSLVVHHSSRTFMQIVNIARQKIKESDLENFVNEIINEHKLSDGITLCKICHDNYHKEHGK